MKPTKTWTPERKKAYQAEYHRNRWKTDPEFRKRHRDTARESAKRIREWRHWRKFQTFPYGFKGAPGLEGKPLMLAFMDFIQDRFLNHVLTHAYFEQMFDPRCRDAEDQWNKIVAIATERCHGFNPLSKL